LTPMIYEPDRKDIRIDASLAYELTSKAGKLEEMNHEDRKVLEEARSECAEQSLSYPVGDSL